MGSSSRQYLFQGVEQVAFMGLHRGDIQMALIALVDVKRFAWRQLVAAVDLPGQSPELGVLRQADANGKGLLHFGVISLPLRCL